MTASVNIPLHVTTFQCNRCGGLSHLPYKLCPDCGSGEVEWGVLATSPVPAGDPAALRYFALVAGKMITRCSSDAQHLFRKATEDGEAGRIVSMTNRLYRRIMKKGGAPTAFEYCEPVKSCPYLDTPRLETQLGQLACRLEAVADAEDDILDPMLEVSHVANELRRLAEEGVR
jgi:hypothetical protein